MASPTTQQLIDAIRENRSVTSSAVDLLQRLFAIIREKSSDEAALLQAVAEIEADSEELAAAVAANTPAEEPPTT